MKIYSAKYKSLTLWVCKEKDDIRVGDTILNEKILLAEFNWPFYLVEREEDIPNDDLPQCVRVVAQSPMHMHRIPENLPGIPILQIDDIDEGYWKKRCLAAELALSLNPGDPDVYDDQIEAHSQLSLLQLIQPVPDFAEIETICSMCGFAGNEHKISCKTPSLRRQIPKTYNENNLVYVKVKNK